MSNSNPDDPKLLPGCWLESPWDPGTAGPITEQTHLIDLIPLYKAQWLRYFLFWAIIVGGVLALGILVPPTLNAMKIPVPDLIKLGGAGLDRWLESVLLFLTAATSYLAWRIRRQKPECITRGWIMFFCVGVFLYMSLDRTAHCIPSTAQSLNVVLNDTLTTQSVSLQPDNILYWETGVYGVIYLALLSRLMIEFSGASMAQLFLLAATAAYACSRGLWFAPNDLQLPLTIKELSGALTLAGDFCLFWSLINYTRFILLQGFGLDSEGWHTAIRRYRYRSRYSSRRNSYIQSETDASSDNSYNTSSYSTDQTSSDANSPFAYDDRQQPETNPFADSQYSQTVSSVTTSAQTPELPYNSTPYGQPYNSPYPQQPQYGQQTYSQQPYDQRQAYGQSPYVQPHTPYEQQQYGQAPYNSSQNYNSPYQPQNAQRTQTNAAYPVSGNSQLGAASAPNGTPPIPPRPNTAGTTNPASNAASTTNAPTAEEVQKEFQILEQKIHRQLTHDEKKAVVRRMIRERQGK
ncbi:MAG: hypothetical protein IKW80_09620 [Thermoguttaceae bacterium]|nr:hypothetical protein [Thermoguttaceae bacterium]